MHTRSSDEPLAHEHLERQGYHAYYPRLIRRVRVRGKRVRQVCPLFPRYLFVQLLLGAQDLSSVRSTRGVRGVVKFGAEYAVVPDWVIEQLHGHADATTGLHPFQEAELLPHSTVRITGGPFEHFEGIFLRECADDRVVVLFNIVGQATPVEIDSLFVESVHRSVGEPVLLC